MPCVPVLCLTVTALELEPIEFCDSQRLSRCGHETGVIGFLRDASHGDTEVIKCFCQFLVS